MADFSKAVDIVLRLEGGYQNDVDDRGNYNAYTSDGRYTKWGEHLGNLRAGTNRGISAYTYSSILGRQVTEADMRAISRNRAISIYRKLFWDKIKGDHIRDQKVAEVLFDAKVNQTSSSIRSAQKVLNQLGLPLAIDGIVGPNTLAALNKVSPVAFIKRFVEERRNNYYAYVKAKPSQKKFLRGWLKRLEKFALGPAASQGTGLIVIGGVLVYWLYKLSKDE